MALHKHKANVSDTQQADTLLLVSEHKFKGGGQDKK